MGASSADPFSNLVFSITNNFDCICSSAELSPYVTLLAYARTQKISAEWRSTKLVVTKKNSNLVLFGPSSWSHFLRCWYFYCISLEEIQLQRDCNKNYGARLITLGKIWISKSGQNHQKCAEFFWPRGVSKLVGIRVLDRNSVRLCNNSTPVRAYPSLSLACIAVHNALKAASHSVGL